MDTLSVSTVSWHIERKEHLMAWDTRKNGDIILFPLMEWGTAGIGEHVCGLRLVFARDHVALRSGGEVVQVAMTAEAALRIAEALREMAEGTMQCAASQLN
jgi:hypothetical protein